MYYAINIKMSEWSLQEHIKYGKQVFWSIANFTHKNYSDELHAISCVLANSIPTHQYKSNRIDLTACIVLMKFKRINLVHLLINTDMYRLILCKFLSHFHLMTGNHAFK